VAGVNTEFDQIVGQALERREWKRGEDGVGTKQGEVALLDRRANLE
jgi:hypothetical protein